MKQIEPILRKVINNYFSIHKQANMDSEAARNNLARHIADTLKANEKKPNKEIYIHDAEFMTTL
jgi:hypothetical protein